MKSMKHKIVAAALAALTLALTVGMVRPTSAYAHCDTMDGPVVEAARQALQTGNLNLVLIWVQPQDEPELRDAFQKSLKVRQLSPEARELADNAFFETLVRLHRAGEGAGYTGLKPAGLDFGPAIPTADTAVAQRSGEALLAMLTAAVHDGLHDQLSAVLEKQHFDPNDVEAGRAYVGAYVEYVHWVERLFQDATGAAPDHTAELAAHAVDAH